MMNYKKGLLAALTCLAIATALFSVALMSTSAVADERLGDHWRNFDGHWSYWHEGDKRWYYTDGIHWYYHTPAGWVIYQFDKLFGLNGFRRGDYHVPGPGLEIEPPRHKVFGH